MKHSKPLLGYDDIAQLKAHLGMPTLHYHDLSAQRDLRRALERWPLLAETELGADLDAALRHEQAAQAAPAQESQRA